MAVTEKLPGASKRSSTLGLLGRLRLSVEEPRLLFSMSHLVCVSPLFASYITTSLCRLFACGKSKSVRVRTGSSSAYGHPRP
jgi:hypothetical protein